MFLFIHFISNLKKFSLKFQNKKSSDVKGYTISLKEEKDKIYLEKQIFFDRERTLEQIFEENDRKIVIFFEYRGKIYPFKLIITKAYFEKIKNNLFSTRFFQHQGKSINIFSKKPKAIFQKDIRS